MTETGSNRFNLVREPWLPCRIKAGISKNFSLLELFEEAAEVRDLADPSPLSRITLLRFLLAILYRTQAVEDEDNWSILWQSGWDGEAIKSYFEKWEDRFDLFSGRYPFYQRADLDIGDKLTPVSKLSHEFAAGNNKQLFDHSRDDAPLAVSPARAARLLIECQGWAIGGGISGGGRPRFTTAALPKGACVVPVGENLQETLLLNLVPLSQLNLRPRRFIREGADDQPAWERAGAEPVDERPLDGPADYLTWQFRYLRIIPEDDGLVRWIQFAQGEKLKAGPDGQSPIDPFHAFKDEKKGPVTKGINPAKSVWRDAQSLLLSDPDSGEKFQTSAALHHLYQQQQDEVDPPIPEPIPVLIAGIAIPGGQPPPDLWCADLFRIPVNLIRSQDDQVALGNALKFAEQGRQVLWYSIRAYAHMFLKMDNGDGDPDAIKKLASALCRETDYWAALESPFHEFLPRLSAEGEPMMEWKKAIRAAAESAFEASLASQDATGRHLRALNKGRSVFNGRKQGINSIITREEALHD